MLTQFKLKDLPEIDLRALGKAVKATLRQICHRSRDCWFFSNGGCRNGGSCHFKHETPPMREQQTPHVTRDVSTLTTETEDKINRAPALLEEEKHHLISEEDPKIIAIVNTLSSVTNRLNNTLSLPNYPQTIMPEAGTKKFPTECTKRLDRFPPKAAFGNPLEKLTSKIEI